MNPLPAILDDKGATLTHSIVVDIDNTNSVCAWHRQITAHAGRIPRVLTRVSRVGGYGRTKIAGIIEQLDLLRPIYRQTAAYGHFGREDADFTWEKTDKADALKAAL